MVESSKALRRSSVIDSLRGRVEQLSSNVEPAALAYFYFDFNDSTTLSCTGLLCSIATQLLYDCPVVASSLRGLFAKCENGRRRPQVSDLVAVLFEGFRCLSHAYIVLDGLDECKLLEEDGRDDILIFLGKLLRANIRGLHVLLSSRKEPDIQVLLRGFQPSVIDLDTTALNEDIPEYVKAMLGSDKYFQAIGLELKAYLQASLLRKVDGSYVTPLR